MYKCTNPKLNHNHNRNPNPSHKFKLKLTPSPTPLQLINEIALIFVNYSFPLQPISKGIRLTPISLNSDNSAFTIS